MRKLEPREVYSTLRFNREQNRLGCGVITRVVVPSQHSWTEGPLIQPCRFSIFCNHKVSSSIKAGCLSSCLPHLVTMAPALQYYPTSLPAPSSPKLQIQFSSHRRLALALGVLKSKPADISLDGKSSLEQTISTFYRSILTIVSQNSSRKSFLASMQAHDGKRMPTNGNISTAQPSGAKHTRNRKRHSQSCLIGCMSWSRNWRAPPRQVSRGPRGSMPEKEKEKTRIRPARSTADRKGENPKFLGKGKELL